MGYALGSVGTAAFSTVPGLLLAYYLTNSLGVAAALAALVVLVPKLWDVVFLPLVGRLSDRSAQARRSRRPLLLAGGLTLPVLFVLMFAVPAGSAPAVAAVWVLIAFTLAASAFAVFQVPYIAMPAEITDSTTERTTLMSWRVGFLAFGILLCGVGAPALRDAAGYVAMAAGVGAVIAVGMLGCWWAMRRTRPVPAESVPAVHGGLRQQLSAAWRTRAFRLLLGAFVLQALATAAMLGGAQYFATYVLGQESMSDVLFAALIVPALVVMPLWAWVGHRRGKRAGYATASVVFLAGAVLLLLSRSLPTAAILALVGLCGIGYAGMQMFPLAMLPDTVAADARGTGRQRAGTFTGVWTAGETVGFAVGPALVLLVLAATGFVSSSGQTAAQPESALTGVLVSFTVLPAALVAASLPLIARYRLEGEPE